MPNHDEPNQSTDDVVQPDTSPYQHVSLPNKPDAAQRDGGLVLGFSTFGLLIGTITGMTTAEITVPLVGLLFAVFGGSILAILSKLSAVQQRLLGKCLTALSIACLIGIVGGIWVSEHRLLTPQSDTTPIPANNSQSNSDPAPRGFRYLRSARGASAVKQALQDFRNSSQMTPQEGLDLLSSEVARLATRDILRILEQYRQGNIHTASEAFRKIEDSLPFAALTATHTD